MSWHIRVNDVVTLITYTPELSQRGSVTLRRLAWFRGKPMTETLGALLEATARTMSEIRLGEVCSKCRDYSRCEECAFQTLPKTDPPQALSNKSDHYHHQ